MLMMIDSGKPTKRIPDAPLVLIEVGEGSAQEHGPEPTLTSTNVPGLPAKALPPDRRPRPSKGATPDWRVEVWRR